MFLMCFFKFRIEFKTKLNSKYLNNLTLKTNKLNFNLSILIIFTCLNVPNSLS